MIVGYVKEKKVNSFSDFFKRIEVECFNNNYIISIIKKEKFRKHENSEKEMLKQEKIIGKVIKTLKLYKIDTIVFSKDIKNELQENILEKLSKNNYNIQYLNGKKMMKYMDWEIINYILEKQEADIGQEEIYIIFKTDKKYNISFKSNLEKVKGFLNKYIYNFKLTNLVANDIRELKKLQEYILEKDNILISVSNNKRKALKRAKYIINANLKKNELEKYRINRDAIIINLEENIIYDEPTFNGININYFELEIPDEYIETFEAIGEKFDFVTLYESMVMGKSNKMKKSVNEIIKEDKIRIKYLIGNNGKISTNELKQLVKTVANDLDKNKKLV